MVYAEIPVIHLNHVLEAKYFQDDKMIMSNRLIIRH